MRYAASEKLEIIRTVETSHLPVRRTLDKIGIPKTTFYAWLDRYAAGGFEALEDRKPRPRRIWNRIPDEIRDKVIERALDEPELSPREVVVAFTDAEKTFVSEASVYRILKADGLVTSPAFIVMKAADRFANPTTAINQLWQTDFTYLKVTGWGWFYLSTVLDDFSRYIVAWKLCTTMSAADVTATLELALQASGLEHTNPDRQPRLLSDNGPSYVANDLSDWLEAQGMRHTRGKPYHPMTQGKIERCDSDRQQRPSPVGASISALMARTTAVPVSFRRRRLALRHRLRASTQRSGAKRASGNDTSRRARSVPSERHAAERRTVPIRVPSCGSRGSAQADDPQGHAALVPVEGACRPSSSVSCRCGRLRSDVGRAGKGLSRSGKRLGPTPLASRAQSRPSLLAA